MGGAGGVCVSSPLPFILAFRPTCSICPSAFLYSNTLIIKFPSKLCRLSLSLALVTYLLTSFSPKLFHLSFSLPVVTLSSAFSTLGLCHLPSLFEPLSPAFSLSSSVTCLLSFRPQSPTISTSVSVTCILSCMPLFPAFSPLGLNHLPSLIQSLLPIFSLVCVCLCPLPSLH